MKYRQIGLGTKIQLELYDENGERLKPTLISKYEKYDEDNKLMEIYAPIHEGRLFPVHPKMRMDIIYSKENDTYMFRAEVIERIYENQISFLIVKPVSPIEKIQRRAFFRMDCRIKVQYRVFELPLPNDEIQGELIQSYTRDISGGGMRIVTHKHLKKEQYLEAFIELDIKIRVIGKAVRSVEVIERGKIMYETGIEFRKIENMDRERIISYIFETQRNRLKKGWMKV